MAEASVSARIPEDMEKELERFVEAEQVDRSIAVRKLLDSGIQKWKQERALRLFEEGKATLSKAAQIAGIDLFAFADIVKSSAAIWVKVKPDELRKELKSL